MGEREQASNGEPGWWSAAILALLAATIAFRTSRTLADPDLWWHLKAGEELWRSGRIPRTDPYSYLSAGHSWINHEWLAELVTYAVFATAADRGLIVFKMGVALALVFGCWRLLRRRGSSVLGAAFITAYAAVVMLPGLGAVRPQLFSYGAFLILLVLLDRVEQGAPRALWLAPPIFAVWANLHGGFMAGLAALAIWAVVRAARPLGSAPRGEALARRLGSLAPPLVASVAATLVNPYGVQLWRFLPSGMLSRPELDEWNTIQIVAFEGAAYLVVLTAAAAGLIWSRRPRSAAMIAVFVFAACLPLVARRHAPLFALAALVVSGEHVADACSRWVARRWPAAVRSRGDARRPLLAALAFAEAAVLLALTIPQLRRIDVDRAIYPVDAVARLGASGVAGNLAVFFDWGGYALWHLAPRVKVSIDGRRETAYPADVYWENLAFTFGLERWDAVLDRGADLALVSKDFPAFNLMRLKPGWTLVHDDTVGALFARDGTPQCERIRTTAPPRTGARDGRWVAFP